jgi:magnesium-transporting ATPase (P-type)
MAILDRLSCKLEQHFLDATKEDLIKFSTKGYRTLCFAIKVLDYTVYSEWADKYAKAKLDSIKLGLSNNDIDINAD